jgi:hypothetical protein
MTEKTQRFWKNRFLSLPDGILHSPEKPVCVE